MARQFFVERGDEVLETKVDDGYDVAEEEAKHLAAITANYRFCGYEVLPEFAILDIFKNPTIDADLERYRQHLAAHAL